jgi:hypothetical protein
MELVQTLSEGESGTVVEGQAGDKWIMELSGCIINGHNNTTDFM